jgi:transposase-like protein
MRYTIKDLRADFPDDESCLEFFFDRRYGDLKTCPKCGTVGVKFYRVNKRMAYKCKECRQYIYPLAGTIFEKSTTSLTYWVHAIYLFSVSKNGVSALELERQIGVSYKTAHRMEKMIRQLMREHGKLGFLGTPIEMDEAYIKGRGKHKNYHDNSTPVLAALEVGGHVRTQVVERANSKTALPFMKEHIDVGSMLHTDESKIYQHLEVKQVYRHKSVRHIAKEFVKDGVTTNHVEGFFGQLKRSLDGTYHAVSPYYLHSYVAEFAYRYNHRKELIFPLLMEAAARPK